MRARLWSFSTELTEPVVASGQVHRQRTHLLFSLEDLEGIGWGEIAPQPMTLHGDAGFDDVVDELGRHLLPSLMNAAERDGSWPHWSRVTRFGGSRPASPWAVTLCEMAALDADLRQAGQSLVERWPRHYNTPTMVSLPSTVATWPERVLEASRVRLKVSSELLTPAMLEALGQLRLDVLLDFNCSAPSFSHIHRVVEQVQSVAAVVAVEQPFAPGNVVEHALLARELAVALSLDEGVRTRRDVDQIANYGAAAMVCLKPARLGGYANTRTIVARARECGLTPYLGGFFEAPLARTVNQVLARNLIDTASDIGRVAVLPTSVGFEEHSAGLGVEPSLELLESSTLLAEWMPQAT